MCIELPGRVVELPADRPDVARIDVAGVIKPVHLGLLDGGPPRIGDWLATHLGFAVAKITEAEAAEAIAFAQGGSWDSEFDELLAAAGEANGTAASGLRVDHAVAQEGRR